MEIETLVDSTAEKREYFPLTIKVRSREHFYTICSFLNKEVGCGKEKWGSNSRVLKALASSNGEPVEGEFRVFVSGLTIPKEEFKAGQIATMLTLKGGPAK